MLLSRLVTWRRCGCPWMPAGQQRRRTRWEFKSPPHLPPAPSCLSSCYILSLLQYGQSASYYAAYEGRLEALYTLLAAGANPAAIDKVRGELWGDMPQGAEADAGASDLQSVPHRLDLPLFIWRL